MDFNTYQINTQKLPSINHTNVCPVSVNALISKAIREQRRLLFSFSRKGKRETSPQLKLEAIQKTLIRVFNSTAGAIERVTLNSFAIITLI